MSERDRDGETEGDGERHREKMPVREADAGMVVVGNAHC